MNFRFLQYHYVTAGGEEEEAEDRRISGRGEDRRINRTMKYVGLPIIQSAISSVLGVIILGLIGSYVVRTFVKTVILVIGIGMLHGLVFLPVIYSFILPSNEFFLNSFQQYRVLKDFLHQNFAKFGPGGTMSQRMNGYFTKIYDTLTRMRRMHGAIPTAFHPGTFAVPNLNPDGDFQGPNPFNGDFQGPKSYKGDFQGQKHVSRSSELLTRSSEPSHLRDLYEFLNFKQRQLESDIGQLDPEMGPSDPDIGPFGLRGLESGAITSKSIAKRPGRSAPSGKSSASERLEQLVGSSSSPAGSSIELPLGSSSSTQAILRPEPQKRRINKNGQSRSQAGTRAGSRSYSSKPKEPENRESAHYRSVRIIQGKLNDLNQNPDDPEGPEDPESADSPEDLGGAEDLPERPTVPPKPPRPKPFLPPPPPPAEKIYFDQMPTSGIPEAVYPQCQDQGTHSQGQGPTYDTAPPDLMPPPIPSKSSRISAASSIGTTYKSEQELVDIVLNGKLGSRSALEKTITAKLYQSSDSVADSDRFGLINMGGEGQQSSRGPSRASSKRTVNYAQPHSIKSILERQFSTFKPNDN